MMLQVFLIVFTLILLEKMYNYIHINNNQNQNQNQIVMGQPVEVVIGTPIYNGNNITVELQRL